MVWFPLCMGLFTLCAQLRFFLGFTKICVSASPVILNWWFVWHVMIDWHICLLLYSDVFVSWNYDSQGKLVYISPVASARLTWIHIDVHRNWDLYYMLIRHWRGCSCLVCVGRWWWFWCARWYWVSKWFSLYPHVQLWSHCDMCGCVVRVALWLFQRYSISLWFYTASTVRNLNMFRTL